jgi:hypothetical protein
MIYCPYSDKEIEDYATAPEHIFPLALGGTDAFCIPVDRNLNSSVGSSLDGAIANDTLVMFRRRHFNAVGHSKKPPVVSWTKARIKKTNQPVQVTLPKTGPIQIFDPIQGKPYNSGEDQSVEFTATFKLAYRERLKFSAKVSLAGGLFIYGDYFKLNVNHYELRQIMNMSNTPTLEDVQHLQTRCYDEFSQPSPGDADEFYLQKSLCELANGSCLITIPGPRNIGFTVGVLGKFMAHLNVPANTDSYPHSDSNDLGHVILIRDKQLLRFSYRAFLQEIQKTLLDSPAT